MDADDDEDDDRGTEAMPSDEDEPPPERSDASASPSKCMTIFLLLILGSSFAMMILDGFSWAHLRPTPPQPRPTSGEERVTEVRQQHSEMVASNIPKECRSFKLVLTPVVSGTYGSSSSSSDNSSNGNARSFFGYFYDDSPNAREDDERYRLGALERSNDPMQVAAAELARVWLTKNGEEIFHVIGNFQYSLQYGRENSHAADDLGAAHQASVREVTIDASSQDGEEEVEEDEEEEEEASNESPLAQTRRDFTRYNIEYLLLKRNEDEIHFHFKELKPGIVTTAFLGQLQDEVRMGSDTWAGGDIGDITLDIARRCGFEDVWEETLSRALGLTYAEEADTAGDAVVKASRMTSTKGEQEEEEDAEQMGDMPRPRRRYDNVRFHVSLADIHARVLNSSDQPAAPETNRDCRNSPYSG